MNADDRRAFLRQVFFVAWAMLTLVLAFCIGILVYEMVQRGQNLLETTQEEPVALPRSTEPVLPVTTKEVKLYFADTEGRVLTPEPRRINFSEFTVENCRAALQALTDGPQDRDRLRPILSAATTIRAMYLLETGELVIDFARELTDEHRKVQSAALEMLMVCGIVKTLTQDALRGSPDQAVSAVRILEEGAPARFPAHLDVSEPIRPDLRWLAGAEG